MYRQIFWRIAVLIPVLFVISVLVFVISKAGPADPVKSVLSAKLTPEQIEEIRGAYGLNLPAWQQYLNWLTAFFTNGGGTSFTTRGRVSDMVFPAFGNTLLLVAAATVVTLVVGVTIGFVSGVRHGRLVDRVAMLLVQVGSNLPTYWVGVIVIWLTAVKLGWLPAGGKQDLRGEGGAPDLLRHIVAPAVAAALVSTLIIARFVRAAVIENLESDHIRTFRSQGFGPAAVLGKHVGRNVLPPIVNITGLTIGSVLTGVVFVEAIFSWPGIGTVLLNAIAGSDYPVIQSGILLVAITFVLVNLIADVVLDLLNPRLRHTQARITLPRRSPA
ncbi:ABC transporter permease [Williamsia sterculiae]|uniref:Peptide/nickel transport system permease protein n=1 Tax=Williamsia sterculiae TaxID=1344003 RepID=A0A1N7D0D7_9NOCA|nr:ABC transporter permease [Williamsia sterculiae]SIR69227.1 peptide/nickel transport system permease protein [Williamsia sterculiae]